MAITFHVLNAENQAESTALIERIKHDHDCACFGAKADEWAIPFLHINIHPLQIQGKPFSATAFAADLFLDGNLWRVPHDSAVFIGEGADLDAYCCAAVILKKHGQLTFEDMGIMPDGNFIHRLAAVDAASKNQSDLPDLLLAISIYVQQEQATDQVALKKKVTNVLKWLTAGVLPGDQPQTNILIETMKSQPKTLGETLNAIAPFLKTEHESRLRDVLCAKTPLTPPTEEEMKFIELKVNEAWNVWGENQIIHHETLAHWLSCFLIPRPNPFVLG